MRGCDKRHCHVAECRNMLKILGYPLRSMSSSLSPEVTPMGALPDWFLSSRKALGACQGSASEKRARRNREADGSLGQRGCAKQSCSLKFSVGERESFTLDDLPVCCLWMPLLRSFCFPVKHFMTPAIKEVTKFSPS